MHAENRQGFDPGACTAWLALARAAWKGAHGECLVHMYAKQCDGRDSLDVTKKLGRIAVELQGGRLW